MDERDQAAKTATPAAPREPMGEIPSAMQSQLKVIDELFLGIELLTGKIAPIMDRSEKDIDPGDDRPGADSDLGGQIVSNNDKISKAARIIHELYTRVKL